MISAMSRSPFNLDTGVMKTFEFVETASSEPLVVSGENVSLRTWLCGTCIKHAFGTTATKGARDGVIARKMCKAT